MVNEARRAYELARAKRGLLLGGGYAAALGGLAVAIVGSSALPWVALVLVIGAFAEWRGTDLARGARRGLVAGGVMLFVPITILRPCCKPGMPMAADGSCCTMPEACLATGAVLGLLTAAFLPRARGVSETAQAAAGMALGTISVAALRCAPLFFAESVGLLAGLLVGLAGVAAGTAWRAGLRGRAS